MEREFDIVCSTWIKEEDMKVIEVIKKADEKISVAELAEIAGVSVGRVRCTLSQLKQQKSMAEGRKRFVESLKD